MKCMKMPLTCIDQCWTQMYFLLNHSFVEMFCNSMAFLWFSNEIYETYQSNGMQNVNMCGIKQYMVFWRVIILSLALPLLTLLKRMDWLNFYFDCSLVLYLGFMFLKKKNQYRAQILFESLIDESFIKIKLDSLL